MFDVLQVLALILVVLALCPSLAHALEFPGKMRLPRDTYLAIQPIYYPGFTFVGISEPLAMLAALALLWLTPRMPAAEPRDFWLTLLAVVGMASMQAVYWLFTHPVNRAWLKEQELGRGGAGFFAVGSSREARPETASPAADWTRLRNRWEYSHVARAALAGVSFIGLAIAVS